MKPQKIIKKWAKLRHSDPNFYFAALSLFNSLSEHEKQAMLKEFTEYIQEVEKGAIIPTVPKIPIRIIKNKNKYN